MLLVAAAQGASGGGGGNNTVIVAIIAALAMIIAACLPTLLSRSSKSVALLQGIRNDARLHRERDDVRFGAVFGVVTDPQGRPLRDPWPNWGEPEEAGGRRNR